MLKGKLDLLSNTNMVDFAMDVHRTLYPDQEVPAGRNVPQQMGIIASLYPCRLSEAGVNDGLFLQVLTGPFLAELGISASCASSVLIIDLRLCACV